MGAHSPELLQLDLWDEPLPTAVGVKPKTVLSYGLGADSTLVLIEMLRDPLSYGLEPDLSDLIVITATVGSEWEDTVRLVEEHIFPLLRRHRVRYLQVARCGPYEADGWEVLADSRAPYKFIPRGRWTLMDELSLNGTVVQAAGGNTCSLKYKGWPLDRWAEAEFPTSPFRKIVGYDASTRERKRAATYDACQQKENAKARRTICTVEYPLIEHGWDRDVVEARLFAEFGFLRPKSYCTFCVYAGSCASRPAHMARLRDHLPQAVEVLALEYTSMALNENGSFYPKETLYYRVAEDGNTAALRALEDHLASAALYRIRRVFPAARTDSCRERHGDSCRSPWPGCVDPDTGERTPPCAQWHGPVCRDPQPACRDASRKGQASRSVKVVFRGTRAQVARLIRSRAQANGEHVEEGFLHPLGHVRSQAISRGSRFPSVEEFHTIAPSCVIEKQKENFEKLWRETCRQLRLPV